ncbi:hypothetical protein [Streptomyces sp. RPT161]|uniref:hypothetical protein n=1 Tax=Streptomyces sp. RPT161 TaxID=3015993 RepID=UPI0022B86C8F|nr:hypothetical protein [Streptomyces sp. RPT161]
MNLIDPDKIPQFTGNLDQLESEASGLKTDGGNITKSGGDVHSTFQGLSAFYRAPEAEQLFATTKPVADGAKTFGDDLATVASALSEYANEVRPIAQKLKDLRRQAADFRARIQGHPHWRSNQHSVDEHNNLWHEVNATVSAFWDAERKAAGKIESFFCGVGFTANDGSNKPNMYGYTASQLNQAKELPWGQAVEQTYRWNSLGSVLGSLGHYAKVGVWDGFIVDGVWGGLKGLGHLVNVFDPHTFCQSWAGLGDVTVGFLSKAIPNLPAAANSLANGMAPGTGAGLPTGEVPQWMQRDQKAADAFARSFVAWDEWKTNPVRAAGSTVFNVGTLAAGPLTKIGEAEEAGRFAAAAKAAGALGKAGRLVDPMTYVAKAVGTAAGKLPKLSDIAAALDSLKTGDIHGLDDLSKLHGVELPDGATKFSDGSVLHNGEWHFPDGTVIEAHGANELVVSHVGHDTPLTVEHVTTHAPGNVSHDLADPSAHHSHEAAHSAGTHADHALPGPADHSGHAAPTDPWIGHDHPQTDGIALLPGQTGGSIRPPDDGTFRSWMKTEKWANDAYTSIRGTDDVPSMAAALHDVERLDGTHGFSTEELNAIKHHIFEEEHPLESVDGGIVHARYDANPDMAEAWIRLRSGQHTPADVLLLEHELAEHRYYVAHPGAPYTEAHAAATKVADWSTHREPPAREDYSAPFSTDDLGHTDAGSSPHAPHAPPHAVTHEHMEPPGTTDGHAAPGEVGSHGGNYGGIHLPPDEPPRSNLVDGSWEGPNGLTLSPEANAATHQFLDRAVSTEPHITEAVQSIAHDVDHAKLNGLEYRLKGGDSLKRKIATAMLENPELTPEGALARIKDSLRYTVEIPSENYTHGVQHAVDDLRSRGFENVTFKNTWESSGYKGINSTWRDPSTGQMFEVQFHTPESFTAKMDTHVLYERERLPGTSADEIAAIKAQQHELFGRVPVPPHADTIHLDHAGHDAGTSAAHERHSTALPTHREDSGPPHTEHTPHDGQGDHGHTGGSDHATADHRLYGDGPADPQLNAAELEGKTIGDRHGVDINYTANAISPEVARDINKAMDALSSEYPATFKGLEVVHTIPAGEDSVLAYAILHDGGPEVRGIYLDSGDFADYGERMRLGAEEEAANWTVPGGGSVQGIFYHEFGHHLAQQIFDSPAANQELEHRISEAIGRPYDSSSEPHDPITESEVALLVSDYGATDPHEMMAELFTEYKLAPSPRPLAVSIGQMIDKYLKP